MGALAPRDREGPFGVPIAAVLGAASLAFIAFFALAFAVAAGTDVDRGISSILRALDTGPGEAFESGVGVLLGVLPWTLLVLLVSATLWRHHEHTLAALLASGVSIEIATSGAKLVFRTLGVSSLNGYPSGHVARIAVTGGILLLWLVLGDRRRVVLAGVAIVTAGAILGVGAGRVIGGEHRPVDVAGGVLLALGWVLGIAALTLIRRDSLPVPLHAGSEPR
jgi:membrane-associated phospholipid phosphatase